MSQHWTCPVPSCTSTITTLVAVVQPPRCSGSTETRTHKEKDMVTDDDQPTQAPTVPNMEPFEEPTAKTKQVNKPPANDCQCNAIPVEGKPGRYESCGQLTKGTFAVGHDAKLKSALIKCAVAGIDYVTKPGRALVKQDPMAVAIERGWGHFVERALERQAAKEV